MKVLVTADPELPVPPKYYGGIERIVDSLVKGLQKQRHEVTLCAHPESTVDCELIPWNGKKSQDVTDIVKNAILLTKTVRNRKFDIVHSFSRLAYLTAILPTAIPKIMSYQREPSISQVKKAKFLSYSRSLAFTGCSEYISKQISPYAEAHTIYNCVPLEVFKFVGTVNEDAPLVFLGRIEEIKGTHLAIEVAKRTGKRLLIAGNIPPGKESYFEAMIKPHLNSRIEYIGPVNDYNKNELLGSASAFLMPIQWNEPFGIVMAEAMACGTPVLGLAFGSVPEVVDDGVSGYVCKSVEEMVLRIPACASIDRSQVRAQAEQRFSDHKIVADYLRLYNNKINERNR